VTAALQRTSAETALGMALPTRRDEEWKWTDLRRLVTQPFAPAAKPLSEAELKAAASALKLPKATGKRLFVINGQVLGAEGLDVQASAPPLSLQDPVLQLNQQQANEALTLKLAGNIDQPIEIVFATVGQRQVLASRLHIDVADHATATIVETHVDEGENLCLPVVSFALGKGARLDRSKLDIGNSAGQHLSHTVFDLQANARLVDFTLTSGAGLSRQNVNVNFNGQNASANVSGSYLLAGSQHADTRIVVDHKVPHCVSRETFKCVMEGESRGIFQGKVIVRKDAQKTDGKQSSHALLLSDKAEFDAKPELEIYADDVVCGHGTTCGDLNHDHVFYLQSRGIPSAVARALLVKAFVAEAFDVVENETIREHIELVIDQRLAHLTEGANT
jgi:Fe-S cluster assembly protein SufD